MKNEKVCITLIINNLQHFDKTLCCKPLKSNIDAKKKHDRI